MSLTTKIKKIRDALNRIGVPTYHYWRETKQSRYIIWAEDTEAESLHANDRKEEQAIHGTTDLFTKTEYDPAIDSIEEVFDADPCITFRLKSVQFEDETNFIHYEWEWEVN